MTCLLPPESTQRVSGRPLVATSSPHWSEIASARWTVQPPPGQTGRRGCVSPTYYLIPMCQHMMLLDFVYTQVCIPHLTDQKLHWTVQPAAGQTGRRGCATWWQELVFSLDSVFDFVIFITDQKFSC